MFRTAGREYGPAYFDDELKTLDDPEHFDLADGQRRGGNQSEELIRLRTAVAVLAVAAIAGIIVAITAAAAPASAGTTISFTQASRQIIQFGGAVQRADVPHGGRSA
jgi:hypothetical protein